jgi:hypothetical protein
MADIFISYKTSDRPRAEVIRGWFEAAGWSVWIDREVEIGQPWEGRIVEALAAAKVVVVIWSAEARRSDWVLREAKAALEDGRLIQVRATALPPPAPFGDAQGVRMESWSGAVAHGEKRRLMTAVAERLGVPVPAEPEPEAEQGYAAYDSRLLNLAELVFFYCARRLEFQRLNRARSHIPDRLMDEFRTAFGEIAKMVLPSNGEDPPTDEDGVLHHLIDGFTEELELLAPDPNMVK